MALIYVLWWLWEKKLGFMPLGGMIKGFSVWMVHTLYHQCEWALTCLLRLEAWYDGHHLCFGAPGTLTINNPCSGIQQFTQFTALMVLYPGPWIKKAWYIPAGLILVHLTNLLRIIGLSLVIVYWPVSWNLFHDFVTKAMFYLVFFLLWVVWEEWIRKGPPVPLTNKGAG